MALKLVIYFVHDTYTRNRIREKIKAFESSESHVTELSESTYAIGFFGGASKTAAEILDVIKPYKDPAGDLRIFVIDVTPDAATEAHGDSLAVTYGGWMTTFKGLE